MERGASWNQTYLACFLWLHSPTCMMKHACSMIRGKRLEFQHMWEMQDHIMLNRFHHMSPMCCYTVNIPGSIYIVSLNATWLWVFPCLTEKWSADNKWWSMLTQAVCAASGYTFPVWRKTTTSKKRIVSYGVSKSKHSLFFLTQNPDLLPHSFCHCSQHYAFRRTEPRFAGIAFQISESNNHPHNFSRSS